MAFSGSPEFGGPCSMQNGGLSLLRRAGGVFLRARIVLALVSVAACGDVQAGDRGAAEPSRRKETRPAPEIRVRVARAEKRSVDAVTSVPAVVSAFRGARIAAEVAGRVVERLVEPGDRVLQGAALVSLDQTQIGLAVKEAGHGRDLAQAELSEAKRQLDRGVELHRRELMSKSEIDALRTSYDRARANHSRAQVALAQAERTSEDSTIRAPFDGSVESVSVDVGEYLRPGEPVATISDFSRARLRAGVTAAEAASLQVGQMAQVSFDALGGATFEAALRSIGRMVEADNGTYPIELWLEQPDSRLREGMIGDLRFVGDGAAKRVVVPRAAVVRRGGRMAVFIVEGSGLGDGGKSTVVRERGVRTGLSDAHFVEVIEGLQPGDTVVVDGLFALGDGTAVAVEDGGS